MPPKISLRTANGNQKVTKFLRSASHRLIAATLLGGTRRRGLGRLAGLVCDSARPSAAHARSCRRQSAFSWSCLSCIFYKETWSLADALGYMSAAGFVLAQIKPVAYRREDPVSMVELDGIFRQRSVDDKPSGTLLN